MWYKQPTDALAATGTATRLLYNLTVISHYAVPLRGNQALVNGPCRRRKISAVTGKPKIFFSFLFFFFFFFFFYSRQTSADSDFWGAIVTFAKEKKKREKEQLVSIYFSRISCCCCCRSCFVYFSTRHS